MQIVEVTTKLGTTYKAPASRVFFSKHKNTAKNALVYRVYIPDMNVDEEVFKATYEAPHVIPYSTP